MNKNETVTCTYLYADGHAVQVIEKRDPKTGVTFKFIRIYEVYAPNCKHFGFTGRIIFGSYREGLANLVKSALRIEAKEESIKNGSENTRKMSIAVGSLELQLKEGRIHFDSMPNIISGEYTYQPEVNGKFDASITIWGDSPVAKIYMAKKEVDIHV